MNTRDTLNKLGDELMIGAEQLDTIGAPMQVSQAAVALAGMLYYAARHPDRAFAATARMIADADQTIAKINAAVAHVQRLLR